LLIWCRKSGVGRGEISKGEAKEQFPSNYHFERYFLF
jgi:hypothetical protein